MKAIVNTGSGRLEMLEWPTPEPGPEQVRIRTGACGICATDLEMIAGWERTGFPAIPGHEWAGTVDAAGDGVDRALVGRRCVGENVWSAGGEVGFEHPGGYGQYFVTEAAKILLLPDDFPLGTAALIEPLAVAVRARRRLRPDVAGPILILGDGPIGLLMLLLLRWEGDRRNVPFRGWITLVGGRAPRLALAAEFGAARTLNYHQLAGDPSTSSGQALAATIRRESDGGYATIVEASGSALGMETALEVARPGARILVLGDYRQARASFRWNHLLHRELELIGSNASAGAWPEAVRLAVEERLPLERLITHRLPAVRFEEGIALVRDREVHFASSEVPRSALCQGEAPSTGSGQALLRGFANAIKVILVWE